MRYTVDLLTGRFVSSVGSGSSPRTPEFKRGDSGTIEVEFCNGPTPTTLDAGATVVLGVKERGKYDDGRLIEVTNFTESGGIYSGTAAFDLAAIDAALNVDGDSSNDVAELDAMMEVSWTISGVVKSCNTLNCIIANDVNRDDDDGLVPAIGAIGALSAEAVLSDNGSFSSGAPDGGYVEIDGTQVEFVENPGDAGGSSYIANNTGLTVAEYLAELAAYVNGDAAVDPVNTTFAGRPAAYDELTAVATSETLTLTVDETGAAGNAKTVSTSGNIGTAVEWDAATFTGGRDARNAAVDDFVATFERVPGEELTVAQKETALAELGLSDSERRAFIEVETGWTNVATAHGADSSGVVDCTAQIQAAFDTRKNVYFPPGEYRFSDRVLGNTSGQVVRGDNWMKTKLVQYSTDKGVIEFTTNTDPDVDFGPAVTTTGQEVSGLLMVYEGASDSVAGCDAVKVTGGSGTFNGDHFSMNGCRVRAGAGGRGFRRGLVLDKIAQVHITHSYSQDSYVNLEVEDSGVNNSLNFDGLAISQATYRNAIIRKPNGCILNFRDVGPAPVGVEVIGNGGAGYLANAIIQGGNWEGADVPLLLSDGYYQVQGVRFLGNNGVSVNPVQVEGRVSLGIGGCIASQFSGCLVQENAGASVLAYSMGNQGFEIQGTGGAVVDSVWNTQRVAFTNSEVSVLSPIPIVRGDSGWLTATSHKGGLLLRTSKNGGTEEKFFYFPKNGSGTVERRQLALIPDSQINVLQTLLNSLEAMANSSTDYVLNKSAGGNIYVSADN